MTSGVKKIWIWSAISVGAIGLIWLLVWLLTRQPKQPTQPGNTPQYGGGNTTTTPDTDYNPPSTTPSVASDKASGYAERLHAAMKGIGTNVDEIMAVMGMIKSQAELKAVDAAFGTRQYVDFGFGWTSTPLSLAGWFTKELNAVELQPILDIYKMFNVKFV